MVDVEEVRLKLNKLEEHWKLLIKNSNRINSVTMHSPHLYLIYYRHVIVDA